MSTTATEQAGRGTGISPDCLQEVLESGRNAGATGQGQFETPVDFARLCAKPLPSARNVILDMCAGHGQFLVGAMNQTTECFLASDIESMKTIAHPGAAKTLRINGDACKLYALAKEIDFQNDLTVSNPPYSVHWKRDVLAPLAGSDLETVRRSFLESDTLSGKDGIDSTAAAIMMMLDLFSTRGEGVVICNNSTAERLILNPAAPYHLLETHCWARVVLLQNPMTGEKYQSFDKEKRYETAVLYFARGHDTGLRQDATYRCDVLLHNDVPQHVLGSTGDPPVALGDPPGASATRRSETPIFSFEDAVSTLSTRRYSLREGPIISRDGWGRTDNQADLWKALRAEWDIRSGRKTADFNIWLNPDGTIGTYLSIFDERNTVKIPKEEAKSLFELTGKKCMQLVMQRADRQLLLHHCNGSIWRVDPRLKAAVEQAVAAYHAVRAPLMPLNDIQRLGYLDENDEITCKADLEFTGKSKATEDDDEDDDTPAHRSNRSYRSSPRSPRPRRPKSPPRPQRSVIFRAGKSYKVRTQTVTVTRTTFKPGMDGEDHEHYLRGQELAIYITDETGAERCFMDKRLQELQAKVEGEVEKEGYGGHKYTDTGEIAPSFDLETLVQSFAIPSAPDVSVTKPEQYRANLTMLETLEQMINTAVNPNAES